MTRKKKKYLLQVFSILLTGVMLFGSVASSFSVFAASENQAGLEITTSKYGNAAVHKDGNEVALLTPKSEAVVEANLNDVLEIRAYGEVENFSLKGAVELEKTTSKNDDKITVYKVKMTDTKATASLTFKEVKSNSVSKMSMAKAVSSGTVSKIGDLNNTGIGKFWVNATGGNLYGVCCERENTEVPVAGNTAYLTKLNNTEALARIAYYGARNKSEVDQYITSAAASYTRNGNYGDYSYWDEYKAISKQAQNGTLTAGPLGFEAYIGSVGSKQRMLLWRTVPVEGYLKLKKVTASDNELVAECPEQYSLEGAEYGVYKTEDDARKDINKVTTLVTDKNGNSKTATLTAGTYYVKEVVAPKGYALDKTIHSVTIKSGATSTVQSADPPLFDPFQLKLQKVATEGTDKNLPLEGAEYTVKYYKEYLTEEEVKEVSPHKTWIFETNEKGIIRFSDDFKVGGDELFKNEKGYPIGLMGTYTIEETKAPQGFAKTEGLVALQHFKKGEGHDTVEVLKDITDNEKPQTISITLNKVDAETGENKPQGFGSLAGAEYDLFYYDPLKADDVLVATLVTDENGFARFEGGKAGLYKIKEKSPSAGYVLKNGWQIYRS